MKYFDLGFHIQKFLYDAHALLYWSSIIDLGFLVLGIIIYLRLMDGMAIVWLFTPHFFKGVLGLTMHNRLPVSHRIIRNIEFPGE